MKIEKLENKIKKAEQERKNLNSKLRQLRKELREIKEQEKNEKLQTLARDILERENKTIEELQDELAKEKTSTHSFPISSEDIGL